MVGNVGVRRVVKCVPTREVQGNVGSGSVEYFNNVLNLYTRREIVEIDTGQDVAYLQSEVVGSK